jgi:hypothetical protein
MLSDDTLRVYWTPKHQYVFVFASRVMVFVHGNEYQVRALPEDDGEGFLRAAVRQRKWKRIRSFNVDFEEQVERVMLTENMKRGAARVYVRETRRISGEMMQRILGGVTGAAATDDILDAEILE